jgi:hypothetical protein
MKVERRCVPEKRAGLARRADCVAVALGLATLMPAAHAENTADLKDQIEALQRRVALIEALQSQTPQGPNDQADPNQTNPQRAQSSQADPKQAQAPQAADAVTAGSLPGSFKLPGSDTSVKIGGYIKLDAIWNSRSAGLDSINNQLLSGGGIPVGPGANTNDTNHLTVHARETRFSVATSTPTELGDLNTLIETDFFGTLTNTNETDTNSDGLRLRHAWGTLGHFGAGQYWTNFLFVPAFAETLDFGGPVGTIFARQAQVRWTDRWGSSTWAVSLENPESIVAIPGTASTVTADADRVPDIVASDMFQTSVGKFYFGALLRDIRVDSASAPAATQNRWGSGLSLAGVLPVGPLDDFRFNVYGGDDIGRYQPLGFFPDAVVDTSGGIGLINVVGGYGAFRHFWKPGLRTNLVLSASSGQLPAGTFGGINKSDASSHINLIWSPVKNADVGVEFIHARREVESGQTGSLNRIQFSSKFSFS